MEIRLYRDLSQFSANKHFYCAKVVNTDVFEFSDAIMLFKAIYGNDIIINFICV